MSYPQHSRRDVVNWSAVAFGVLILLLAVIASAIAGFKAFGRYQNNADAHNNAKISLVKANNQVKVTEIEIRNQNQRVKVAQQQAQIRFESAKGVRESQDEIAKTLTPLYVQFEMTQALVDIAKSGKNSSVIYIPSGANGIPLVSGAAGSPAVGAPPK
jgi:preprotein translocase subunit SecF